MNVPATKIKLNMKWKQIGKRGLGGGGGGAKKEWNDERQGAAEIFSDRGHQLQQTITTKEKREFMFAPPWRAYGQKTRTHSHAHRSR